MLFSGRAKRFYSWEGHEDGKRSGRNGDAEKRKFYQWAGKRSGYVGGLVITVRLKMVLLKSHYMLAAVCIRNIYIYEIDCLQCFLNSQLQYQTSNEHERTKR
jgi:hypothetical protein